MNVSDKHRASIPGQNKRLHSGVPENVSDTVFWHDGVRSVVLREEFHWLVFPNEIKKRWTYTSTFSYDLMTFTGKIFHLSYIFV